MPPEKPAREPPKKETSKANGNKPRRVLGGKAAERSAADAKRKAVVFDSFFKDTPKSLCVPSPRVLKCPCHDVACDDVAWR